MSIQIDESFRIAVPIETVWQFLLDPRRVVTCMPGPEPERVLDDRALRSIENLRAPRLGPSAGPSGWQAQHQ